MSIATCGYCSVSWDSENGSDECPMCELIVKIDQHIESILLQILTSHYSKYIFEIDDKTAAWNREQGLSFRINRKHNLVYLTKLANISVKNTYLLIASHIETAFNDIQRAYKLINDNDPPNTNNRQTLYELFVNIITRNQLDEGIFKEAKNSEIVNFVRLISNTIKHKNSLIDINSSLGKRLKIKSNIELDDLWGLKIPNVRNTLLFGCTCEITHLIRVFLLDLTRILIPTPVIKLKSISLLNTLNLPKVKIRENISNEIVEDVHNEGLIIIYSAFFKKANDSSLFSFLKERIALLEKLNRINPKYVVAFETGIGNIPNKNKSISRAILSMNNSVLNMHRRRSKLKANKAFRKLYINTMDKLSLKYGRAAVSDLVWNEFDCINKKILPALIINFYREIHAQGKKNAGILVRGFGGMPFRKWNPFNFNT